MKRPTLSHAIVLVIPILLLMYGCGRTIDPGSEVYAGTHYRGAG